MKRYLTLLAMLAVFPCLTYSQAAMVTYDARNDINQTNQYLLSLKDFEEVTQQTQLLKDTYDFYKKAQETMQKVNRVVNDFYAIENIVRTQVQVIKFYGTYMSAARGFQYVSQDRINSYTSTLGNLSNNVNQLFKQAKLILRDDYFKMSDAERLKFLADIDTQMSEKKTLMKMQYDKLKAEEDEQVILNSF